LTDILVKVQILLLYILVFCHILLFQISHLV
jgi:hypothetical protein